MLAAFRSLSSLSELSEDRSSETTCSPLQGPETEELEIYAQLDRVNARRLDAQCAVRRPHRQRQALLKSDTRRLVSQDFTLPRLASQDLTPPRLRRIASLERVADGLAALNDARSDQRHALSEQRLRELFLVAIAARLRRVDGAAEIKQCAAEHPRDHMRRFVIASIGRINSLTDDRPMAHQRFSPLL
ncbi:hypothetical protein GGI20_002660 [Coemansia sp. BCRC 34301]|nr:hypothetical protein GGI20_002660 [Coemansia sp. BCRC 34301]